MNNLLLIIIPLTTEKTVVIIRICKAADGKATKIIIPSEIQGMAGLAKSIVEVAKED